MEAKPDTPKPAWYARKVPNDCAWPPLLFLLLIGLSVWFPINSSVGEKSGVVKLICNGRQLLTTVKIYASENEGKYPPHLIELETSGVLNNLHGLTSSPYTDKPLGWIYRPGFSDSSASGEPILVTPILQKKGNAASLWLQEKLGVRSDPPLHSSRVVVFNDAAVQLMKEEEFQQMLKTKGITLSDGLAPERKP